ncbi:thiol peroxidase [Trueperella bialowiezensis]|uniref:Thiol peroxidase n=1 Tax=Trueperella bialowiezensis TaxID=312285 RepID=A0A3S4V793_9ACTO|nr:thiol peroxidase [Trueperella bialowiezensis]VEI13584.1 Thiol peroxidase [Trueperella bialowiezensis]
MATITFNGTPITTIGDLPAVGTKAPDFTLTDSELGDVKLSDFAGKRVVLNIFPSLDTGICAQSVRQFNKLAEEVDNTVVVAVSLDLPFAHERFCTAEGIKNVVTGSAFRSSFPEDYGVTMAEGPLTGLLSRSVVIIDGDGTVIYTEQVPETKSEPDYDAARAALS